MTTQPNKPTETTEPKKKERGAAYVAAKLHTELAKADGAVAEAKAKLDEKTKARDALVSQLNHAAPDVKAMVSAMRAAKQ